MNCYILYKYLFKNFQNYVKLTFENIIHYTCLTYYNLSYYKIELIKEILLIVQLYQKLV